MRWTKSSRNQSTERRNPFSLTFLTSDGQRASSEVGHIIPEPVHREFWSVLCHCHLGESVAGRTPVPLADASPAESRTSTSMKAAPWLKVTSANIEESGLNSASGSSVSRKRG